MLCYSKLHVCNSNILCPNSNINQGAYKKPANNHRKTFAMGSDEILKS